MRHLGWFQWHAFRRHVILSHAVTRESQQQSLLTVTVHHATFPDPSPPRNMAANLQSALYLLAFPRQQTRLLYLGRWQKIPWKGHNISTTHCMAKVRCMIQMAGGPARYVGRVRHITKSRRPASTCPSAAREQLAPDIFSLCFIFIHLAVCLTTGPKPLPKRALHIVRSRASSFKCVSPSFLKIIQ
jgi:hypothetical protein